MIEDWFIIFYVLDIIIFVGVWQVGYKVLFTDLDGTFLNSKSEFSEANKEAVRKFLDAGFQLVICSGRSWRSLEHFEKQIGLIAPGRYGVAFNGAIVYETLTKKFLYEDTMENSVGLDIANTLLNYEADIVIYSGDKLISSKETDVFIKYRDYTRLPATIVNNFNEVEGSIIKVLAIGENKKLKKMVEDVAPKLAGICGICFSSDILLEFAGPDVNKGRGMMVLADHLGYKRDEIVAMGDQGNDVQMLKEAGLGIAVANSVPAAREAADITLEKSNNEDAVSYAINKWFLS